MPGDSGRDVHALILQRLLLFTLALTIYVSITMVSTVLQHQGDQGLASALATSGMDIAYWLPGLIVLIPIAIYDLIRISNRCTGPVRRVETEMRRLLQHQSERPISYASDELWVGLSDQFNQVRGELLTLRKRIYELENSPHPTASSPHQVSLSTTASS